MSEVARRTTPNYKFLLSQVETGSTYIEPTFSFLLQVALTLTEVIDVVKITFPNKKAQVRFLNVASVKIPWRQ